MSGPITGLLNRSPRERQLRSGFIFVLVLLVVSRVLPFIWTFDHTTVHAHRRAIEEGAKIASGIEKIPELATQPHLPSYLTALTMVIYRQIAGLKGKPEEIQQELVDKSWLFLFITRALGSLCWIIVSLQVYYVIKWRTDYNPALFALIFMTISPISFSEASAGGTNLILALIVFNALLCAMKIRSRGDRRDYILGGLFTALATGYAYHFIILVLPLFYTHARSQNRRDNFFADIEWHLRGLSGVIIFLLAFVLCHPQLWSLAPKLAVANPIIELGKIPQHISLKNLFLNNDIDNQLNTLTLSSKYWGVFKSLGHILGYGALIVALLVGLRGLFQRDQRPWRPMAIFAYTFIAMRFWAAIPGVGTLTVLAPVLCTLLTVGILGIVLRHAFSSEKKILVICGLILSIECLANIAIPVIKNNYRTTSQQFRIELRKTKINPHQIYQLGTTVPSVNDRYPTSNAKQDQKQTITKEWALNAPDTNKLKQTNITHILANPEQIKALLKQHPEQTNLNKLRKTLSNKKHILTIEPTKDGSVIGPTLVLVEL